MSKRGPKHQHRSAGNRQYQREISCEELLQLAARSLRDARTQHDRGQTDLTALSKDYLRDIATDGGALARCRDCFPLDAGEPSVVTTIEEDEFTGRAAEVHRYTNAPAQELGVVDATKRPGALNGTDTEHVAASAGKVSSNAETSASQKPTAHTQSISIESSSPDTPVYYVEACPNPCDGSGTCIYCQRCEHQDHSECDARWQRAQNSDPGLLPSPPRPAYTVEPSHEYDISTNQ